MIIIGGIGDGVGSAISGGNFWQGAGYGLIAAGLNHALHMGLNSNPVDYTTENANKVYEEYYGNVPEYTKIVADGTYPINEDNKNWINNNGVVTSPSKEINTTNYIGGYTLSYGNCNSTIYIFKSSFSSKNLLVLNLGHEMFHANLFHAGINGLNRHHSVILIWQFHISRNFSHNTYEKYNNFRVWSDYKYAPKLLNK